MKFRRDGVGGGEGNIEKLEIIEKTEMIVLMSAS